MLHPPTSNELFVVFPLSFAIRFVRTRYLNALKILSVLFSVSAGADVVRLLLLLFPVI